MRLADLALARGTSLSAVAVAVGVRPLLLQRVDVGMQPMPRDLAVLVGRVLGVSVPDVLACCPLVTEISSRAHPVLLNPIPPRQEEPQPPAKLMPTSPTPPPSGNGVLYAFGGPESSGLTGSTVVERYRVLKGGGIARAGQITDADAAYTFGLMGAISGVIGLDGKLWFGGDNPDLIPVVARVEANTLAAVNNFLWEPLGLHIFAKGCLDPVSGRVWVTIADGKLYAYGPDTLPTGPEVALLLDANDASQACTAMCFPGDGYLYAATFDGVQTIIQKIDPRPGHEAVLQVSNTPGTDVAGGYFLVWLPEAQAFYTGTQGGLYRWDLATLSPTFIGEDQGAMFAYVGGGYDRETDSFWTVSFDFTSFAPCRVPRGTGVADFTGESFDMTFSATYSPGLANERVAFYPCRDLVTEQALIVAYKMDAPAEFYRVPFGTGPNPPGYNNIQGSVLYAPP